MHGLGTPCHKKKLFTNLIQEFPDSTQIVTVFQGSRALSSAFIFIFKKTISDLWTAFDITYKNLYPHAFLYWELIKYGCQQKMECFDFGRSTAGSGVHNFKLQWGTTTIPLQYQYLRPKKVDNSNSVFFKNIFPIAWSLLPRPVANYLGPIIRTYIP
jgi:hypothetical protein